MLHFDYYNLHFKLLCLKNTFREILEEKAVRVRDRLTKEIFMEHDIARLLNEQVNHELYSGYIYLAFSHFYSRMGLDGFENWFFVQAKEEVDHATIFIKYLQDNGETVSFSAIPKCEIEPTELTDPLHAALKHEKYITGLINNVYRAAEVAKDYRTREMLRGFILEQCEEERAAAALLSKATMIGTDSAGIYMLNSELKARQHRQFELKM